ncbi:MAG: PBSX family phage terminase large subunit [Culicoidibacterales bacterium]
MTKMKKAVFKWKPLSKKQKQVLTWWSDGAPEHIRTKDGVIADGAIRSGKTVSMSFSFVLWAMSTFDGAVFGMCGKTIGSFRRNVLFWLKLMLFARGYKVVERRSENCIIISKSGISNFFYIFGGKDEASQDLVQGLTLSGVFFDEVALMPESFVNQATGRCSVDGSKFWFNCNPNGPFHWFKTEWIDKQEQKNMLYLHFTMDDNLSLTEDIKKRYMRQYVGVFFKRYILGLWVAAEGVIYDMFVKEAHVLEYDEFIQQFNLEHEIPKFYVAIDYGTQNPTAFLLIARFRNFSYVVKEYYHSGRETNIQKTDVQYADDLEEFIKSYKIESIIVDPAAASFIAELRSRELAIRKARNDVVDGIRFTGTKLTANELFFSYSCKSLMKEFASYVWDIKASKRGEDKPTKENDHALDALRYYCYTILFVVENKAERTRISKSLF